MLAVAINTVRLRQARLGSLSSCILTTSSSSAIAYRSPRL
jgi:hypothetical protein